MKLHALDCRASPRSIRTTRAKPCRAVNVLNVGRSSSNNILTGALRRCTRPAGARAAMRSDSSPISVAFADPVLRAAGLENDSYGEAKRFFKLTDRQLHKIIC
jgi:hypothetical protein